MASRLLNTRTVHTIEVTLTDDTLAAVEIGDDIEIILVGRYGGTRPRKLSYADVRDLTEDQHSDHRDRPRLKATR